MAINCLIHHWLLEDIKRMKHEGRKHVIIVLSENILDSKKLAKDLEMQTGFETRTTILGYLQRGGKPSAMDRVSAGVLGYNAVDMLLNKEYDKMIYFANNHIYSLPLEEAIKNKNIDYMHLYKVNEIIG